MEAGFHASWTVGGGWSPARPYQVLDGTQFPGNNSPVVDSRGFTSTAILGAAAPVGNTDTGQWFPSPGGWEFSVPLIIGGKMDIWDSSIGYALFS